MGKLIVVVGGQFGSEAKGHIAAYLGRQEPELFAVRVGGPNAGHTVIDIEGVRWSFRHLPVAAVQPGAILGIAAGSEIDPEVLAAELRQLHDGGYSEPDLNIDPSATVILEGHRIQEAELIARIGSTGKGIGAARADRIMRLAPTWGDLLDATGHHNLAAHIPLDAKIRNWLDHGGTVLLEGTQGYGLGLHAGYYPHCTSGDCRAIDVMAQAGISPWDPAITELQVWVVFRTYPIRVAGPSGPLKNELTWDEMEMLTGGLVRADQPELTTVTRKPRRIGEWDPDLANAALDANGRYSTNVHIALTFADYMDPGLAGRHTSYPGGPDDWLAAIEKGLGLPIELIGTGPATLIDRRIL